MTGAPRGIFFDFFSAATPDDASARVTATKAASTRVLLFRDISSGGPRRRRVVVGAAPLLLVVDAGERSNSTNSQCVWLRARRLRISDFGFLRRGGGRKG